MFVYDPSFPRHSVIVDLLGQPGVEMADRARATSFLSEPLPWYPQATAERSLRHIVAILPLVDHPCANGRIRVIAEDGPPAHATCVESNNGRQGVDVVAGHECLRERRPAAPNLNYRVVDKSSHHRPHELRLRAKVMPTAPKVNSHIMHVSHTSSAHVM